MMQNIGELMVVTFTNHILNMCIVSPVYQYNALIFTVFVQNHFELCQALFARISCSSTFASKYNVEGLRADKSALIHDHVRMQIVSAGNHQQLQRIL